MFSNFLCYLKKNPNTLTTSKFRVHPKSILLIQIITIMKIININLGKMNVEGEESFFVVGPNTPEGMKACQIREEIDREYGQSSFGSNALLSIAGKVTNPANLQTRTFMVNVPEDWSASDVQDLIRTKKLHIRAHYQNVPFEDVTLKTAIRYAVERGEDPDEAYHRFTQKQLIPQLDDNGQPMVDEDGNKVPLLVDDQPVYRRYELVSLVDNPEAFEDVRKTVETTVKPKTEVSMDALVDVDEQEA